MNVVYRNAIGDHGASLVTHIGLVDELGDEIAGGDYARQAVTWTSAGSGDDDDGTIRPTADVVFNIPASTTVGGWRGFSASTGGIDYGGQTLQQESFNNEGEYTLRADGTAINHRLPS